MKVNDREEYEGPRTPEEDEWESVIELSRSIFFEDTVSYWQAVRSWPMFFHPHVRQNLLTMFKDGQPVSTIGRLERDILVHGHCLRMGFIGGVCTHPEHRGKGLASTILDAMMGKFHQNDVDFVYISGTRGLYFGAGANHAAIEVRFELGKHSLEADKLGIRLRPATSEDIDLLVSIAERESVRFIRPRGDFELVLENKHCGGQPCDFHLIELQGTPVGYLLLGGEVKHNKRLKLLEFAGERLGILSALGEIVHQIDDGASLEVSVPHGDLLIDFLRSKGARGELARTGGTMKVIDFCRTMRKLLPYFRERLNGWTCLDLNVAAGKERYVSWNETGALELESENSMLWTLLGKPTDSQIGYMQAKGQMGEFVEQCLPIPVPLLYLNVI